MTSDGVHVLSTIRFSDQTLREGYGNFITVKSLMHNDGIPTWMLRSEVTIATTMMVSDWILHFWNDGRVVIKGTNRPLLGDVPDDDIRELSEFFRHQGWLTFEVDRLLLEEPQGFEFWFRLWRAGVVESNVLKQHEDNETKRFEQAYAIELAEEEKNAD